MAVFFFNLESRFQRDSVLVAIPVESRFWAVAVFAAQLVNTGRVRLKRKFLYFRTAFRAFPIALKHLPLRPIAASVSASVVKSHFCVILLLLIARQIGEASTLQEILGKNGF